MLDPKKRAVDKIETTTSTASKQTAQPQPSRCQRRKAMPPIERITLAELTSSRLESDQSISMPIRQQLCDQLESHRFVVIQLTPSAACTMRKAHTTAQHFFAQTTTVKASTRQLITETPNGSNAKSLVGYNDLGVKELFRYRSGMPPQDISASLVADSEAGAWGIICLHYILHIANSSLALQWSKSCGQYW
jgi:hypothetical protein